MNTRLFQQLKKGKGEQQVIFFPYLGGHADNFYLLANSISEDIDIWSSNLPGHGKCFQREFLQDINSVVSLYTQEIQRIAKSNCIYFGHSMGGIIAYFLLQRLFASEENIAKPAALILSACPTPAEFRLLNTSRLSDKELLEELVAYDGMSEEILKEQCLLDYLMPIFRADFKILESSSLCNFLPLNIPVYFLWGENDRIVPVDSVIKWSKYFLTEINLIPVENGSHMFLEDKCLVVAEVIEKICNCSFLPSRCSG